VTAEASLPAAERDWPSEVARLTKINKALMDRAERSTSVQGSPFSLFQTTIMLEEHVRRRTAELEAALRDNEKVNRALRISEARFRGVVSQSLVGIVTTTDGRITYSNTKFDEMFGYTDGELKGVDPIELVTDRDRGLVADSIRSRASGETNHVDYTFQRLRRDGDIIEVECHGSAVDVGGQLLLISVMRDITERTRAEREVEALQGRLWEQSTHDSLTGLYNRRYLDDTLERELIVAERAGQKLTVIMGDLDHFKAVNDRFGHQAGDEVLRVFGDLMKRSSRASDIYCRYGGEEFLLVLPGMPQAAAVERAEQLRAAIAAAPISYGAHQIAMTVSFGVASYPRDGRTGDELITAADAALYAAKTAGRNRVNVGARHLHVAAV